MKFIQKSRRHSEENDEDETGKDGEQSEGWERVEDFKRRQILIWWKF